MPGLRLHDRVRDMLVALTVVMAANGTAAGAAEMPSPPMITVVGEAGADVVPDLAVLSLGVEAERATAAAATDAVAAAAQAVLAQLKADGVAETDVATTALALSPVYADPASAQRAPRTFRASTHLRVVVKPAERAGLVASHVVDHGANTIDDIAYGASREDERLDALRADAMRNARHKAEIYAGALGLQLGPVIEITPLDAEARPPAPMMRTMAMAAKATMPTAPGTLTLHASVTVRWALQP